MGQHKMKLFQIQWRKLMIGKNKKKRTKQTKRKNKLKNKISKEKNEQKRLKQKKGIQEHFEKF